MDRVEQIGSESIIQHGKFNNRIYLMKLSQRDFPGIISALETIAFANKYSKVSAKVPSWGYHAFMDAGYIEEAVIPGYGRDRGDLFFLSRFFDKNRALDNKEAICMDILNTALSKVNDTGGVSLHSSFIYRKLQEKDIKDIVHVYRTVFATYPFPIHDSDYILKTMRENLIYFGIFHGKKLAALSSTEIDYSAGAVEMTDFSTLPEYRGNGFAAFLLGEMEKEMMEEGRNIHTSYTIARALSYGMNITFAKRGYRYAGRLINNTNISGNIESMNIWYKQLIND